MRATSFPYQSPKGSFSCGNNGGSSRSIVHQCQFPKTAVIIVAAHTAWLVVFCYNNIIQSPGKQWNKCLLLDNIPVQIIKTAFCCYTNSPLLAGWDGTCFIKLSSCLILSCFYLHYFYNNFLLIKYFTPIGLGRI